MKLTLNIIIFIASVVSVMPSASAAVSDTLRIALEKEHQPVNYGESLWMRGRKKLFRSPENPAIIDSVMSSQNEQLRMMIVFNTDSTVTYRFDRQKNNGRINSDLSITVAIDSMRQYRLRGRGQAEGIIPKWYVGEYNLSGIDYSIWTNPTANVTYNADSMIFLNDFQVSSTIGNVYKGKLPTVSGQYVFTIHRNLENPNKRYATGFPYPCIIVNGKYEDNGGYRPDILNGARYKRLKGIGDTVTISPDLNYRIDSITSSFSELILTKVMKQSENEILPEKAFGELKPYLERAREEKKILLVDFWGTWCGPCVGSMPRLKKIEEQYGDKLFPLAVCVDQETNRENADKILDRNGIKGERIFADIQRPGDLVGSLNITTFPTYMLVDADGRIILRGSGTECLDYIDRFLSKRQPTISQNEY